ncbi:hypothetical protein FR730_15645 [Klebsiella pneumoniae]|nr:hypothetical protein FR730_15645 [Klebsiella pneumoniae]
MPVKHDSRSLIGPIPAVRTQNHQKSGDNEIGFADNCVDNIGITGKEISIDTKVKTIRPLKIKLKIIF